MQPPLLVCVLALWTIFRLAGYLTEPRLSGPEIHQVTSEAAADATPRAPGGARALTIVTWNIQRGVKFERILTTLRDLNADVLLLQEVDQFCRRSGSRHVARDLAAALGMNWAAAGEFQEIGEGRRGRAALSGQAVLSKHEIVDPRAIVFSDQARLRWRLNPAQPRRGGRMALRVRTAGLLVYSAHLESGGGDTLRRSQLDQLVADQAREAPGEAGVIIAGDFNNAPAGQTTMFDRLSAAGFTDALVTHDGHERRTTTNRPHAIDWIFTRNLAQAGGRVSRVDGASDHYPVVATITRRPRDAR